MEATFNTKYPEYLNLSNLTFSYNSGLPFENGNGYLKFLDYKNLFPYLSNDEEGYKHINIKTHFINGIGYGLDGYCCEVGDKKRKTSSKPINYIKISIIGTLFKYKKTNAKVTVDGKVYEYKDVWIASTMKGRFYGGGIMAAPHQDRNNPNKELSLIIFHTKSRLSSLYIMSKAFTGGQTAYPDNYVFHTGKNILVEFDKPRALQIDGETISDVYSYSAYI